MGHNVQSKAGDSLTDVYDVRGGQAPVERILTSDVQAVHELGATIASERFSMFTRRSEVTGILQSLAFELILDDLPAGTSRILGITVTTSVAARVASCNVSVESSQRSLPIWVWDGTNDTGAQRILEGGVVVNQILLVPTPGLTQIPTLLTGSKQPQHVENVALRGVSTAFGAGTLEMGISVLLAFSAIGGISSRGLPIPGW